MSFIVGAVALSLIAALSLLLPLWFGRRHPREVADERRAVVGLMRERLAEIEQERTNGLLDDDAYEQLKLEQQRRLLDESGAVEGGRQRRGAGLLLAVIAAAVPLAAFLLYSQLGAMNDWRIQQLLERSQTATSAESHRAALIELAPLLQQQIGRGGDEDGRRRFLLAHADMELGKPDAAAVQYASLADQFPQDASIAGQYAQALYLANNRQLTAQVRAEAERALQLDPNQSTALGLLGIAAFERSDFVEALKHWRKLLAQLPAGSPNAEVIEDGVRRAEAMARAAGVAVDARPTAGPRLTVTVTLGDALSKPIPPGATLFVFVRHQQGPPMPLAVVRQPVGSWPVEVELSDAQAMAPGMNLSSLLAAGGGGEVVARITASGQVKPQAGDFEGVVALKLDASPQQIEVVIDRLL